MPDVRFCTASLPATPPKVGGCKRSEHEHRSGMTLSTMHTAGSEQDPRLAATCRRARESALTSAPRSNIEGAPPALAAGAVRVSSSVRWPAIVRCVFSTRNLSIYLSLSIWRVGHRPWRQSRSCAAGPAACGSGNRHHTELSRSLAHTHSHTKKHWTLRRATSTSAGSD